MSSAGPLFTVARGESSTSPWSRRGRTGPGPSPSGGVRSPVHHGERGPTLAGRTILKIVSSGFLLLLCLEDQHPSLCNMLWSPLIEKGNVFLASHKLWQFCNYYAVFSNFQQIVTLFPWSMFLECEQFFPF